MQTINCNICGSSQSDKLLDGYDRYTVVDKTSFTLVKCRSCGLIYMNPQPSMAELAKYYPADYPPYQPQAIFVYGPILRSIQSLYHRISPPRVTAAKAAAVSTDTSVKKVLDFGCGAGHTLVRLQAQHPQWQLFGFDISANKEVKKIGNVTIYYDDFEKMEGDFESNSFDIIYLNNVLEHVLDPHETLTRLRNLLKPGGDMIIEIPNIASIKFRIFGKYFSSLDIPRHLYHFSPTTIKQLCDKAHLTINSIEFAGTPKSTMLSTHYMLGINKRTFNPIAYRLVEVITKILGEKRINDDSMIVHVSRSQ